VEARTDQDADVRTHVHDKNIEQVVIDLPPAIKRLQQLMLAVMKPTLTRLHAMKLLPFRDPSRLSFQVLHAHAAAAAEKLAAGQGAVGGGAGQRMQSIAGQVRGDFGLLMAL